MNVTQKLLEWTASRFKIPPLAMRMFKASNDVSGVDKKTLPVELIPLNSIQLSRGLLNFTILQSKLDWILPYWAEEQYNPKSLSFIPRSHIGLSINVTHRNWTAVGNPDCHIEPIIDPKGLVMPFKNGWSLDVWVELNRKVFYPSRSGKVFQKLVNDFPIVETVFELNEIDFKLTTYSIGSSLFHRANFSNISNKKVNLRIIFSVRPFNPEGISLLKDIQFIEDENSFLVENSNKIYFNSVPNLIYCSTYKEGDAGAILTKDKDISGKLCSSCDQKLASAIACFDFELNESESGLIEASIPLLGNEKIPNWNKSDIISYWENILSEGAEINTPDEKVNSILRASLSTLVMLTDTDTITAGPFTYHQFWFRDAAYMVWALDNFGFKKYTRRIVESYKKFQFPNGYFRSQKGEWDSNGQALWSVYQHYKIYKDEEFLSKFFDPLFLGVKWIDNKRLTEDSFKNEPFLGLLPLGLSAEHLGLADHYFWDNFWSLAGLKCFIEICQLLNKKKELDYSQKLYDALSQSIDRAMDIVQKKYSLDSIPASPSRNIDCGMIGNVCASYPLQLFDADDSRILSTLKAIEENYFVDGLFFQNFIHSGMNLYLTLQIAHSYLYAGNKKKFLELFNSAISTASPTLNFPEAIHPTTGGGVMGDGHHGWAAAEIALAIHDAFVFERTNKPEREFVFLQGIPKEWFFASSGFYINNVFSSMGKMSINVFFDGELINLKINYSENSAGNVKWFILLPFEKIKVTDGKSQIRNMKCKENEVELEVEPGNINLKFLV